jgi:uncharacterized membrane protein
MNQKIITWINENLFTWIKEHIEWIVISFAAFTILSPFIFTLPLGWINLTATGQIGDTIGGLTAPILNFLSIMLLYLTLREQISSNNNLSTIERRSRDYDIIFKQYDNLKDELDRIEIAIIKNGSEISYKGLRAIFEYKDIIEIKNDVKGNIPEASLKAFGLSLTYFISSVFSLLSRSFKSNLSKEDKIFIYTSLVQIRTPLQMVSQLAARYGVMKGKNATELDKIVIMKSLLLSQFKSEFEKYDPNQITE